MQVRNGPSLTPCCAWRKAGRKKDGEQADLRFRETLCFRKEGGAWKILHQHQSVPFCMDSKLAALNLKPEG